MRSTTFALVLVIAALGCATSPEPAPAPISSTPDTCPTPYTDANAAHLSEADELQVRALLSRTHQTDQVIDEVCARMIDVGLGDAARTDAALASSLAETLNGVPLDCEIALYDEPGRFAIQPALDDAPAARVATIDRANQRLADALQVVVTCNGCPEIGLALRRERTALFACAWSRLAD